MCARTFLPPPPAGQFGEIGKEERGKDGLMMLMVNRCESLRRVVMDGRFTKRFMNADENLEPKVEREVEMELNEETGEMEVVEQDDEEDWYPPTAIGKVAFVEFFLHISDVLRYNNVLNDAS